MAVVDGVGTVDGVVVGVTEGVVVAVTDLVGTVEVVDVGVRVGVTDTAVEQSTMELLVK